MAGTDVNAAEESGHRGRWRSVAAIAVIGLLAGSLAGCGSSTSKGASPPSSTPGNSLTGAPIKIGEIVEIKGIGVNWPFQAAVDEAAASGINSRGGVEGRPIQLHVCDGQNDPNVELQCARTLVSAGVVAVIGGFTLANGAAVDAEFLKSNVAQIGVNPVVPTDFNNSNQFLLSAGQLAIFSADIYNAAKHGLKKIWLVAVDIPGAGLNLKIAQEAAKATGIKVVGSSMIPTTSTNDAPYVQQAISAGADAIFPAIGAAETSTLLLALNQVGSKLKLIDVDSEPSTDIAAACGTGGGVCTGSLGSGSTLPATDSANAGIKLFQQDMAAEVARGNSAAKPDSAYNSFGLLGWLGMEAFAKVAAHLPTITPASVLAGFKQAKNIPLFNIIPNWTPNTSAGIPGYPRISNPYVYLTQMRSNLLPYLTDPTPYNIVKLNPDLLHV